MSSDQNVILVFAPHPDDEVIAVGGTICMHRERGDRVIVIFSTDGSESHAAVLGIHENPSPTELAHVRQKEAIAASAEMGVPASDVIFLHKQDTQLAQQFNILTQDISNVLIQFKMAKTIYLPDPDRELNADHRVTGQAILSSVQTLGLGAVLLKYVVWDSDLEREFNFQNRLDSPAVIDEQEELQTVEIFLHREKKMLALFRHRTQVEMFTPVQTRTVVPPWLIMKLKHQTVETFRVHSFAKIREV